jgi:hypothetical protein
MRVKNYIYRIYVAHMDPPQVYFLFPIARQPSRGLGLVILRRFTITLRHTTLGRTPLDE